MEKKDKEHTEAQKRVKTARDREKERGYGRERYEEMKIKKMRKKGKGKREKGRARHCFVCRVFGCQGEGFPFSLPLSHCTQSVHFNHIHPSSCSSLPFADSDSNKWYQAACAGAHL